MVENQRVLAESENYILSHEFEYCELRHKQSNKLSFVGDHYGDPTCGLIAPDETWCITGGFGLVLWFKREEFWTGFRQLGVNRNGYALQIAQPEDDSWLTSVTDEDAWFVRDMRLENPTSVRILLDPWSDYASTWLLDITSKNLAKLKCGPALRHQEWSDKEIEF